MKRMLKRILVVLLVLILLAVAGFGMLYAGRLRTVNSIERITAYDDYNLYRMDVTYDYSIDDVINYGITDNQSMIDAIFKGNASPAAGPHESPELWMQRLCDCVRWEYPDGPQL